MKASTVKTAAPGNGKATAVGQAQANDAELQILASAPYIAEVTIEGTATILFHRWSCEDVAEKAAAAKGSKAKKTDNVDSYVYRCPDGTIGIPGIYLKGAIAGPNGAAKYRQDPRSPRKSALDLYKAGLVPLTEVASLGTKEWDFLDHQRVTIQRSAVTRIRPAMLAGWKATFELQVLLPEYISPADLLDTINYAGKLVGLADFRPTYGRFQVIQWQVRAA